MRRINSLYFLVYFIYILNLVLQIHNDGNSFLKVSTFEYLLYMEHIKVTS